MTFEQSLFLAIPGFVLLMATERLVGIWQKKDIYSNQPDVISSLSSGMANITMAVIGIGLGLGSYQWMLENFAVFSFDYHSPLVWAMVIICLDFTGYWVHRISHKFNLLWQVHIVHHSSEEFNLPCALRQTVSGHLVRFFVVFGLPMAVLGIPIEIISVVALVHLYYQYWYHTQLIGSLGWLERIIVTPVQHSIHHAMNPEYIDKNFGQWFSVWDQMFGTYQQPVEGVKPVYGVTRPVRTWNPIKIDFMHWGLMIKDMLFTAKLSDKLQVVTSRTNWRPDDVAALDPKYQVTDVNNFQKYKPVISKSKLVLSYVEINATLILVLAYFSQISQLSDVQKYVFGGFILLNIFTYTTAMEGKRISALLTMRLMAFIALTAFLGETGFGIYALSPILALVFVGLYLSTTLYSFFYSSEEGAAQALAR